ncbi:MAG: hypothetical protein K8H88_29910, partial [Sandaracinaceae bacterium]|nr:hypothetical protein [Sandaracinaceae bacterium]
MSSAALTVAPTRGLPELRISGVYETSPGALRRRVLGPYAEGIAQYLAVRLGDVVRARAAFSALHRWVASLPADELLQPPGPRAQLYRLARRTAEAAL